MTRIFAASAAVFLDRWLGEPSCYHPLIGFGRLAVQVENCIYGLEDMAPTTRRLRGVMAVTVLLAPALILAVAIENLPHAGPFLSVIGLYFALGGKSLEEHAAAVHQALLAGRVDEARQAVGRMVSRETQALDARQTAAATVESVLENGCDAVFGALFWFMAGGLPGVIVYRLANTLDAMWGYRNERYRDFGWAAARLDDVLNWIPARLTALSYAFCGHLPSALTSWRTQGGTWKSPNAGPVMAAGAGALRVQLGGPAVYHGKLMARPALGMGRPAEGGDISRAIELVQRALGLWLFIIIVGGSLLA